MQAPLPQEGYDPLKRGPLEREMATHSNILAMRTPWTIWKGKTIWHQKMSPLRSEGVQYATGEEEKAIANWSKRNEEAGLKQKKCSAMDVSGGKSKFWCCKEQYCIGIWNVGSMNWTWPSSNLQDWMNMDILGTVN